VEASLRCQKSGSSSASWLPSMPHFAGSRWRCWVNSTRVSECSIMFQGLPECLGETYITRGWYRSVQVGTGWYRLVPAVQAVQVSTGWYRSVQVGTGRYRLVLAVQVGTGWYRSVLTSTAHNLSLLTSNIHTTHTQPPPPPPLDFPRHAPQK
jgi:hypothetical protein